MADRTAAKKLTASRGTWGIWNRGWEFWGTRRPPLVRDMMKMPVVVMMKATARTNRSRNSLFLETKVMLVSIP